MIKAIAFKKNLTTALTILLLEAFVVGSPAVTRYGGLGTQERKDSESYAETCRKDTLRSAFAEYELEAWKWNSTSSSWVYLGIGDPSAPAHCWALNTQQGLCGTDPIQWIHWAATGTQWEWWVSEPGIYAADSIALTVASDSDVVIHYDGFQSLQEEGSCGNPTLRIWYMQTANGNTPPPPSSPAWIFADGLNSHEDALYDSPELEQGLTFKKWNLIEVEASNWSCDYQDEATVYFRTYGTCNESYPYSITVHCSSSWLYANFDALPTSGPAPLNVTFVDFSGGNPTSWFWDFGDGYSSTLQETTHIYNHTGYYDVKLVVSNGTQTDSIIRYDYIHVTPSSTLPGWKYSIRTGSCEGGLIVDLWAHNETSGQLYPLWHEICSWPFDTICNGEGIIPNWADQLILREEGCYYAVIPAVIEIVAASRVDGVWKWHNLGVWVQLHIGKGELELPFVTDTLPGLDTIYAVVNLETWIADPQPTQDTYNIVDGTCPELPGFLFGTTPIVFDSMAGPDQNPFSTTPINGQLYLKGETGVISDFLVCGDANGDSVIDVGDVIYLINYLFKNGPVPNPLQVGDANCDGVVDVGDVVYLINYLFKGGQVPGC